MLFLWKMGNTCIFLMFNALIKIIEHYKILVLPILDYKGNTFWWKCNTFCGGF